MDSTAIWPLNIDVHIASLRKKLGPNFDGIDHLYGFAVNRFDFFYILVKLKYIFSSSDETIILNVFP